MLRENSLPLDQRTLQFTERIYIDVEFMLRNSESDVADVIWEYLLTISALLDPQNNAKDMLKQMLEQGGVNTDIPAVDTDAGGGGSDPSAFLMNMMSTIMTSPEASQSAGNPMEMMSGLMNNPDLMSGIMNGAKGIDMNQLMSTVSGLVDTVKGEISKSNDPALKSMMTMLDTQLGGVTGSQPSIEESE